MLKETSSEPLLRVGRGLTLEELKVSLISLFEMQAKAAKPGIPADRVVRAVRAVERTLTVVPFTEPEIVRIAFRLRSNLRDFIDCIVAATAVALGEDLVTEDRDIHSIAALLKEEYGVNVYSYRNLVAGQQ
jgi:predicted nucleic acid-binding protein